MPASASSLSALLPASAVVRGPLPAADSIRLVQALKTVPDPRQRRGRRHGLQSGLLLALQAGVGGGPPLGGGAPWGAGAPPAPGGGGAPPPGPPVPPGGGAGGTPPPGAPRGTP